MNIALRNGVLKAIVALAASLSTMVQGAEAVNIADSRQLFVDRELVEQMDGASLKLHEPISGGVAIRIDKPWEGAANGTHAVIQHDGRYRICRSVSTTSTLFCSK